MKKPESIHIHVWSEDSEEILQDVDAPQVGDYGDYLQFGFRLSDGRWIEIRVPQ